MKKYLVIGNPIEHSLSPEIHNYWLKKNNINAVYEKRKLDGDDIVELIDEIRNDKISGVNVTVPFKRDVIPFLDDLSKEANITQSVNTIFFKNNKITGHNTDIAGFQISLKDTEFNLNNKKVLILGSGGVVPSIIYALEKSGVSQITICNRTKSKAIELKKTFSNLKIVEWGMVPEFDMIINATSLGLDKNDKIDLNFTKVNKNKFFYDVIYNPKETNFLQIGKNLGAQILNGKKMFIYQASEAFKLWHNINPEINDEVLKLLDQ